MMPEDNKNDLKQLAEALRDRLEDLEHTNLQILEKVEDLHEASAMSQLNQVKFLSEHDRMNKQVDEVLRTINSSVSALSLQIRDITSLLKKND